MTTMLDPSSEWQMPVRQVGAAVPLTTEQPAPAEPDPTPEEPSPAAPSAARPDQHDPAPEPAGANNVIPMHPEPETVPQPDNVEEQDSVDEHPSPQRDSVDLDPAPEPPTDPAPNGFSLRHASLVGYCMSVGIAAIGQILALGAIFGGTFVAWMTATIAAAFAEVTMIGAGSWSLELRRKGHPWKLLLAGAGLVCGYAVSVQAVHYAPKGLGQAAVFAGASALGWTLHMAVEHVRVAAYLKDQQHYEAALAAWRERQQAQQPQRSAPSRPSKQQPARKSSRARSTGTTTRAKTGGTGKQSKQGKPRLTQQDVDQLVQSGQLGDGDGPSKLRQLVGTQYTLPAESTVKRMISAARKQQQAG